MNGSSLVKDKISGLWHFDVERTPYTGKATENFLDGSPRAEASFLKGRKDGVERFWYSNGRLKEESQWFDGLANGIIRTWSEDGRLIRAVRYKKGGVDRGNQRLTPILVTSAGYSNFNPRVE